MPTRTFENIINLVAGQNTALAAVNAIIAQLKVLQGVAFETGLSLNANVLNKQQGPQVLRASASGRDITMGGVAAVGRDPMASAQAYQDAIAKQYRDIELRNLQASMRVKAEASGTFLSGRSWEQEYRPSTQMTPTAFNEQYQRQLLLDKSRNEEAIAQMKRDIASRSGGGISGGALPDDTQWSQMSFRRMTTPPLAARVPFKEQLPQAQLSQADIDQMRQARGVGESEMAAYDRQGTVYKLQRIEAEKQYAAILKEGTAAMGAYEAQGEKFRSRQATVNEAMFARNRSLGESAMTAYEKQGEKYQAKRIGQDEAMFARNLKLGTSAMDDYDKQAGKFLMQQSKLQSESGATGRSFATTASHIITGMLVWQGVNIAANTLIGTFDTLQKNYRTVDSAAAGLSVTMGTGKDVASGYAQSMVAAGAQFGMAPQESAAAATFGARVQKEPMKRRELFDVSAMLSQRTGEDQLKLMDNINVASRQAGLTATKVGDMMEAAYNKTGTSATQAGDIIRELGPIAQASGVDINVLFETVIKSADRMGGSAADATNTWTRLWKAVTEPNKAQLDILNKYRVPLGEDVNTKIKKLTQAGLTPEEMGVVSGRPGMPAAANDMRTMFEVMKTLDGELARGQGLAADYAKGIDSIDFSFKRLFATIQSNMGLSVSFLEKQISGGGTDRIMKLYGYDEESIAKVKDAQAKLNNSMAAPITGQGSRAAWFGSTGTQPGTTPKEKETNYQEYLDNLMDLEERKWRRTGANALAPTPPPVVPPAWTPTSEIKNILESGLANMPTSPIDLSKFTGAEMGGISGKGKEMEAQWIASLSKFYDDMGVEPDKKEELIAEAKKGIDTYIGIFKTAQGISIEYGAEAYYKQQSLQQQGELLGAAPNTGTDISQYTDQEIKMAMSQISSIAKGKMDSWRAFYEAQGLDQSQIDALMAAKQEGVDKTVAAYQSGPNTTIATGPAAAYLPQALQQASRQQSLEDRLKELRESMSELNETTKKAQKLEGQWNIPVGARVLAPFAGKALEPEGPDTSDEARKAREMEKKKREESEILAELNRIMNPTAIAAIPGPKDVGLAPKAIPASPPVLPPPLFKQREPGERMETPKLADLSSPIGKFDSSVARFDTESAASVTIFSSSAANFKEGVSSFGSGLSTLQTFANTFGSAVENFLTAVGKMQWQGTSPSSTSGERPLYSTMSNDLINQARIQGVLSQ